MIHAQGPFGQALHCFWMSIIVQQDATIYSFLFPANCSTWFGWYLHPSSGAHINCNYSIWHWLNHICYILLLWRGHNSVLTPPQQRKVANTVRPMPYTVITVYVCSWWWVKVSPETCRAVCRKYNKLYVAASCWTVIDTDSRCTDQWT